MDKYNLNRFIEAQVDSYESAIIELSRGKKTGHWMWYIFPQIIGLGSSDITKLYSGKYWNGKAKRWSKYR